MESPSSPCAIRSPNMPLLANSASTWIAFQSPLSAAKLTMSASVMVRPALVTVSPTLNSSKYSPR